MRTSQNLIEFLIIFKRFGKTEIDDFNVQFSSDNFINHDVLRFYVPVSYILIMQVLKETKELPCNMLDIIFFHGSHLFFAPEDNVIKQIAIL